MADITIDGTTIGANRFLILDSTGKIPAVDGSQVTAIAAGNIATGTIPVARIDTGSTANKIVVLDGSGRLPAVSGALLTGASSSTKSASDPTISTNPSGGVGTEWHNTTSGEAYICTDATAGANVWINIGVGSGDVKPYAFGGSNYSYMTGGSIYGGGISTQIQKFSMSSTANATDVGDLTASRHTGGNYRNAEIKGYASGGSNTNIIDGWSLSSDANAVDVADLALARAYCNGTHSALNGYTCGGDPAGPITDTIQKMNFATEANATDIANLVETGRGMGHAASEDYGFMAGGYPLHNSASHINRFPFASDSDATDWGDLTLARGWCAGHSSTTHGYVSGGDSGSPNPTIDKYTFASATNATDVGDMTVGQNNHTGTSSLTHGYCGGGERGYPPAYGNPIIEKFSFASDGNSVDTTAEHGHPHTNFFDGTEW